MQPNETVRLYIKRNYYSDLVVALKTNKDKETLSVVLGDYSFEISKCAGTQPGILAPWPWSWASITYAGDMFEITGDNYTMHAAFAQTAFEINLALNYYPVLDTHLQAIQDVLKPIIKKNCNRSGQLKGSEDRHFTKRALLAKLESELRFALVSQIADGQSLALLTRKIIKESKS